METTKHLRRQPRAKRRCTQWRISPTTSCNPLHIAVQPNIRSSNSCSSDTGADLDAIPESVYEQNFAGTPLRPGVQPCTAIGSTIITLGCFKATITRNISGKMSTATDTTIHVVRQVARVVKKISNRSPHAPTWIPAHMCKPQ